MLQHALDKSSYARAVCVVRGQLASQVHDQLLLDVELFVLFESVRPRHANGDDPDLLLGVLIEALVPIAIATAIALHLVLREAEVELVWMPLMAGLTAARWVAGRCEFAGLATPTTTSALRPACCLVF